ncbi:MAG: extracellular solute-binding protein, partial [Victivallales bacterium]|nr:extracellular solute-binding protein [Victivallales bacterium]
MKYYILFGVIAAAVMFFSLISTGYSEKQETKGVINVYTSLEEDEIDDYYQLWKQHNPNIRLKFFNLPSYELSAAIEKSLHTPDRPDVLWGCSGDCVIELADRELLLSFDVDNLKRIRPVFVDNKHDPPQWGASKVYVGSFITNTILAANNDITPPESYSDLLDAGFEGRIAMPDPMTSGTGLNFIAAIIHLKGENEGWEYLARLLKNVNTLTADGSEPAKLAGRGKDGICIGISFAYRGYCEKNKGAPIEVTFPEEGCSWGMDANAIFRSCPIESGVYRLMNWTFSDSMMKNYLRRFPVSASKSGELMEDTLKTNYPRDLKFKLLGDKYLYWKVRNSRHLQREWLQRFGNMVK